jgi:hypothetical protein
MTSVYNNNSKNEEWVQQQIAQKLRYDRPYYATNQSVGNVVTDFDDFPYNRWYRGQYQSDRPIIIEREAGYRFVEKNCYITKPERKVDYPKHAFEGPCSTVYPTLVEQNKKFIDQESTNVMLNRACVYKYQ